jgi:hypothetical protein
MAATTTHRVKIDVSKIDTIWYEWTGSDGPSHPETARLYHFCRNIGFESSFSEQELFRPDGTQYSAFSHDWVPDAVQFSRQFPKLAYNLMKIATKIAHKNKKSSSSAGHGGGASSASRPTGKTVTSKLTAHLKSAAKQTVVGKGGGVSSERGSVKSIAKQTVVGKGGGVSSGKLTTNLKVAMKKPFKTVVMKKPVKNVAMKKPAART